MTVGIMSGVMAGAGAEAMGFPHDLQNLVPAFAAAPQLTQMTVSSATGGGDGGALPNGAAHRAQNFAPGTTAAPQEGQMLVDGAASLAATGLPQLRQKRPEPASAPHFGHFIESSNTK